ncbi:MAG: hypothetical protein KIT15_00575 [Xanthobacteraceae bacterium]|nr:hypothetical protein [Xanthobacteraceae bacterium]MBX3524009.1 hypothetical protein [Xanthobacteraceae bacterium]MCW5673049.1 hypothetical protein [Xanthobacteraceae bacterium]
MVAFPLLLISFAIYNMIAFLWAGSSWTATVFSVRMPSGAEWAISTGDILIAFTLFLLFFEVLKAARNTARSIFDHVLSTLIFIGALVEFLLVKEASTSTFAIMLIIALVDVLGGWSVAVRTARRDFSIDSQAQ